MRKKKNDIERLNEEIKRLRAEIDEIKTMMYGLVQVVFDDDEDNDRDVYPNT
ncbi:MAG: hypothetical protein ACP5JT_02130 [Thermoplasmata archaeon]|jgi:hypothetical protein